MSFPPKKGGFPPHKPPPPHSKKGKGKDKPKVADLPFGDRSKAKMPSGMVTDTDNDGE